LQPAAAARTPTSASRPRARESPSETSITSARCPTPARGKIVARRSDCEQYDTDAARCRSGPAACQANAPADSYLFKRACPQAYSYAHDDASSTFTCTNQTKYTVTFCP
jgi:hypothetical protein